MVALLKRKGGQQLRSSGMLVGKFQSYLTWCQLKATDIVDVAAYSFQLILYRYSCSTASTAWVSG